MLEPNPHADRAKALLGDDYAASSIEGDLTTIAAFRDGERDAFWHGLILVVGDRATLRVSRSPRTGMLQLVDRGSVEDVVSAWESWCSADDSACSSFPPRMLPGPGEICVE